MLGLRQVDDPIVTAVVYRRTLRFVDPTEPLFGTPYIGQVVRAGTAEEVANKRWEEEDQEAVREDKTIGLIAALDIFGPGAFDSEILETRRGSRERMSKWADHREVELIAEHGGPLQDMDPPFPGAVRQTFNQTKGGQFTNWASIDAKCAKNWNKFIAELDVFVDFEKHADVPARHVSASGYKLGKTLIDVRNGVMLNGKADEAERRALLVAKGVKMSILDTAWEKFVAELDDFIALEGHADVSRQYTSPSGYRLGYKVSDVRQGLLLNGKRDEAERRALLAAKGVKMNMNDAAWTKFLAELDSFIATKGHADVHFAYKSASEYNLGVTLSNVRSGAMLIGKPDEAERRALLAAKGVKMSILDAAWGKFVTELARYVAQKGNVNMSRSFKTASGYDLGDKLVIVRYKGLYLSNKRDGIERAAWLESLPGWRWGGKYQPPKVQESTTEAESLVARIKAKARAKRKRVQEKRASTFDSEDDD